MGDTVMALGTFAAVCLLSGSFAIQSGAHATARSQDSLRGSSSVECASLISGDELMFRLHSEQTVSIDSVWAPLRAELGLQSWPADSLLRVNDAVLCRRLDSLIVTWLSGPGAGRLVGVTGGSIGPVAVMRIGTTTFHVKPGASLPVQPEAFRPYFVVDTAAPTRVAFWKGTP